ncbi:MAG: phytoene desaturase family protein, partial [Gemmatimonadaceae bacterium]
MKIVVIGAGFGGLAAAIRLRAQGHAVSLVEKRDKPGGRAYVFEQDGFTFDAGPTIITAPWLIDDLFLLARKQTADYVTLVPIDPFYNVRFRDGSVFHYNGDQRSVVDQVRAFNPDDVDGYLRFSASTERIFEKGFALIDKPFTKVGDMIRVLPDVAALGAHRSVASYVNGFIKDERLRQVFSFHPLLVGGNPFQSTAIYAVIHHLEKKWGVWFAMGGTGALVRALAKLFTDLGGDLRLESEVDEIVVSDDSHRATGVRLKSGEILNADAVVSNGDVAFTYMHLIAPRHRPRNTDARMKRRKYSMSLFVSYFGT